MIKTIRFQVLVLVACLCGTQACKQTPPAPPASHIMPAGATPVQVEIADFNCFQERGQFFVTGICNNQTDQWQRIWLRMEPWMQGGKVIQVTGAEELVFPVFSAAIPPRGRSAFFHGWDGKIFSGSLPDTCRVICAGALPTNAGPILLVSEKSMVRMMTPASPDKPVQELGCQFSAVVSNPLDKPAKHPVVELLLYGNDHRLWFASPVDLTAQTPTLQLDGSGDIAPAGKRRFNTTLTYGNLPAALANGKVGNVDALAFELR